MVTHFTCNDRRNGIKQNLQEGDGGKFNPKVACGVSFGRSQSGSEGFYPRTPVFLPPQNRLPVNYIWLGLCCSEITHGSYGGSRAAPLHAFGPIPLSRLTLKSPCRERSTKHIYKIIALQPLN